MRTHLVCRFPLEGLAVIALACGCASTQAYQTTFEVPALSVRDNSGAAVRGVRISLAPITRENEANFPDVARPVRWREHDAGTPLLPRPEAMGTRSPGLPARSVERTGFVELIPLPAFLVGIANNTGSALSLSPMRIEVEDNKHRPYSVVLRSEALRKRFFGDLTGANPFIAGNRALMEQLTERISKLPILSPGITVPDGDIWKGYLVLDINANSSREYYSLMKSIQEFTVRLKDVPTGAVRSDFEFVAEKTLRSTALTCPGEVRDPSPEACSLASATGAASSERSDRPR